MDREGDGLLGGERTTTAMPYDDAPAGTAAMRILVVDDAAAVTNPLQLLFDHYGYESRVVATVAAAIREFDLWLPHVLLLDLKLPDGNGSAVLRHVRSCSPETRVAILSGAGHDPRIVSALNPLRPDHVFTKPADFLEIRAWIESTRPKPPPPRKPRR
jgi:DNA-binding response OmpR family regulator